VAQERQIPWVTGICPGDITLVHHAQIVFIFDSGDFSGARREERRIPIGELAMGQAACFCLKPLIFNDDEVYTQARLGRMKGSFFPGFRSETGWFYPSRKIG